MSNAFANLLQEFYDEKIYIKITNDDFPRLKELAETIDMCFCSGDVIYADYMYRILNSTIGNTIYLTHKIKDKGVCYSSYPQTIRKPYVTVDIFLNNVSKNQVLDEEFLALLEG